MKKASLVVSAPYNNDQIFNKASPLNRDNCLEYYHELKEELLRAGFDLHTSDIYSPKAADLVIYNDMPQKLPEPMEAAKSILLIFESELIRPDNWDVEKHSHFSKILTWKDDVIDYKKYFKFNFSHSGKTDFHKYSQKNKFITLIAGKHSSSHPLELYSKRVQAIEFYEKNHPNDFEFFGVGWDLHTFKGPKIIRALNKIYFLRKALSKKWKSYGGKVDSKINTLKQYRFSICFENARDIRGYITEKVFDSLVAGCIPVYWGAPNIGDYLPENCFVDFNKFKGFDELHDFLVSMSPQEYDARLESIQKYIESDRYKVFTPKYNAEKTVEAIFR